MVLQRDMPLPIWGWAEPGEKVTVKLCDKEAIATADDKGKWMVKLDPLSAPGPFAITISGKNTITIKNVLIGEVSSINDDTKDNRFLEPIPRFSSIEEDEPILFYLCNEYP